MVTSLFQINLDFQLQYPDKCDNLISKWRTNFSDQIIAVGELDYPDVRAVIKEFGDEDNRKCIKMYICNI